uniref:Uncharacterized protein n=1 Tax=Magallana gigas TaxID=29159 RepID=K1QPA7_MAGGI
MIGKNGEESVINSEFNQWSRTERASGKPQRQDQVPRRSEHPLLTGSLKGIDNKESGHGPLSGCPGCVTLSSL